MSDVDYRVTTMLADEGREFRPIAQVLRLGSRHRPRGYVNLICGGVVILDAESTLGEEPEQLWWALENLAGALGDCEQFEEAIPDATALRLCATPLGRQSVRLQLAGPGFDRSVRADRLTVLSALFAGADEYAVHATRLNLASDALRPEWLMRFRDAQARVASEYARYAEKGSADRK